MGQLIPLARRLPPEAWARACATAAMLERQEAERLAAKREAERAWRARPRPSEPEQLYLCNSWKKL